MKKNLYIFNGGFFMLQLKNIFKKYDRVIFDNLSISFPSKGFVFITGENGIGNFI